MYGPKIPKCASLLDFFVAKAKRVKKTLLKNQMRRNINKLTIVCRCKPATPACWLMPMFLMLHWEYNKIMKWSKPTSTTAGNGQWPKGIYWKPRNYGRRFERIWFKRHSWFTKCLLQWNSGLLWTFNTTVHSVAQSCWSVKKVDYFTGAYPCTIFWNGKIGCRVCRSVNTLGRMLNDEAIWVKSGLSVLFLLMI